LPQYCEISFFLNESAVFGALDGEMTTHRAIFMPNEFSAAAVQG
jgi:hypothetical protein